LLFLLFIQCGDADVGESHIKGAHQAGPIERNEKSKARVDLSSAQENIHDSQLEAHSSELSRKAMNYSSGLLKIGNIDIP